MLITDPQTMLSEYQRDNRQTDMRLIYKPRQKCRSFTFQPVDFLLEFLNRLLGVFGPRLGLLYKKGTRISGKYGWTGCHE